MSAVTFHRVLLYNIWSICPFFNREFVIFCLNYKMKRLIFSAYLSWDYSHKLIKHKSNIQTFEPNSIIHAL